MITWDGIVQLVQAIPKGYKVTSVELSRNTRKVIYKGMGVEWGDRKKSDSDIPILLADLDDDTVVLTIKGAL